LVSAGTISVTRHCGRNDIFLIVSARPRSTNSISGLDAQRSEIPKSRFGTRPPSGRSKLDILRDPHRDSASSGKITRETGENFVERPKTPGQHGMWVAILRGA
jgi:hypothetical protein